MEVYGLKGVERTISMTDLYAIRSPLRDAIQPGPSESGPTGGTQPILGDDNGRDGKKFPADAIFFWGRQGIIGRRGRYRRDRNAARVGTVDQAFRRELVDLLPRLRRFARALTGHADRADDLVQAACEKALARSHQWQQGTRLDSWMYRILQTTWIDDRRTAAHHQSHLEEVPLESVADPGALRHLEARTTLAAVRQAMRALPDPQRAVLGLVCVEGLSYREAADALGVPVGTVMSRLARARLSLDRMVGAGEATVLPQKVKEVADGAV